MLNHLIDFKNLPWSQPQAGLKYKAMRKNSQQIRLVEFSSGFVEENWCLNGHAGYVLEGSCAVDFNGRTEHFKAGDILYIPAGETDKHKVVINNGGRVLLLLFENI